MIIIIKITKLQQLMMIISTQPTLPALKKIFLLLLCCLNIFTAEEARGRPTTPTG
jgi:hypothetical protein